MITNLLVLEIQTGLLSTAIIIRWVPRIGTIGYGGTSVPRTGEIIRGGNNTSARSRATTVFDSEWKQVYRKINKQLEATMIFLLLFKQGGSISKSCSSATPCTQYTQLLIYK